MSMIQCGNGHVYDNGLFDDCPYCRNGGTAMNFGNEGMQGVYDVAPTSMGEMNGFPPDDFAQTGLPPTFMNSDDAFSTFGAITDVDFGSAIQNDAPLYSDELPTQMGEAFAGNSRTVGKTVGIDNGRNRTVAVFENDPIVGWLVCVNGVKKGKDFRLRAKTNKIGRGADMDVTISEDMSISDKHAKLDYDSRNADYYLMPYENSHTLYLNGAPVYSAGKLAPYDEIGLGNSDLLFVPFCNKEFMWTKEMLEQAVPEMTSQSAVDASYSSNGGYIDFGGRLSPTFNDTRAPGNFQNVGNTVGIGGNTPTARSNPTVAYFDNDPVAGWLVCIQGPLTGKDFRVQAKVNTVGRSSSSAICITGDNTISASQAILSFDVKNNRFYLSADKGSSMTYVNGQPLLNPVELFARDEIEMGKSKFVFVPFCGEKFGW